MSQVRPSSIEMHLRKRLLPSTSVTDYNQNLMELKENQTVPEIIDEKMFDLDYIVDWQTRKKCNLII